MTPLQLELLKNNGFPATPSSCTNDACTNNNNATMLDLEADALVSLATKFGLYEEKTLNGTVRNVTPPPLVRMVTPLSLAAPASEISSGKKVRPIKKVRESKPAHRSNKASPCSATSTKAKSSSSCLLPTASDPEDPSFLMSLHSTSNAGKINRAHEAVCREILEVHRTISGKVYFQCGCCKHLQRSQRAKLSTLAPRKTSTIYRSLVRFMMTHVSTCEHVPAHIKAMDPKRLRDNKVTGIKDYWPTIAREKGLMDEGGNIIYKY